MARAQSRDSGDSQFFICFEDSKWLDGQYTVWGKVTAGMENVDRIKRGEPVSDPDSIITARMRGKPQPGPGDRARVPRRVIARPQEELAHSIPGVSAYRNPDRIKGR